MSSAWETIDQKFYTRLAQSIDPIDSTLIFYGDLLSSGVLKAYDKKGNEVENDDLIGLLQKPNHNQDYKQFVKEWLYYLYAHGYEYIIPQSSSVGFEKKLSSNSQLFTLDPDNIKFNTSRFSILNFWNTSNNKSVVFDYEPLGLSNISYDDVVPFFDVRQNPAKPYTGISRMLALKQQILNYHLALQAKGNMITRSGSQLIVLDGKTEDWGLDGERGVGYDQDGNPITTTNKKDIENQLRDTGMSNGNKGVTFMMLPLKAMSLSEGLEKIDYDAIAGQDARTMLNKFNVPKEFQNLILSDVAKYDEKNSSLKFIIQNILQPLADTFCNKLVAHYNHENTLRIDFSELPVFADTENTIIATKNAQFSLYNTLFEKNLITDVEFKKILKDYGII